MKSERKIGQEYSLQFCKIFINPFGVKTIARCKKKKEKNWTKSEKAGRDCRWDIRTNVREEYRAASSYRNSTRRKVKRRNRAWQAAAYIFAGVAPRLASPTLTYSGRFRPNIDAAAPLVQPPYFRHICVLFPASAPLPARLVVVSLARTVGRVSREKGEREKTFAGKRLTAGVVDDWGLFATQKPPRTFRFSIDLPLARNSIHRSAKFLRKTLVIAIISKDTFFLFNHRSNDALVFPSTDSI